MFGSGPGWDAIDAAVATRYGDRQPTCRFGPLTAEERERQPLTRIAAFYDDDNPLRPSWHLVTYGFTELGSAPGSTVSGHGFELTMRLATRPGALRPPSWVIEFLQNLARYVERSGNRFGAGHHIDLNGPIAVGAETHIGAVVFANDPTLPRHPRSPNGSFEFLQVIGITRPELASIKAWDPGKFLRLVSERDPLFVTDLDRSSWLDDKTFAERVERGQLIDGSTQESLHVSQLDVVDLEDVAMVTMGAITVPDVLRLLSSRIGFDRRFRVIGPRQVVTFDVAEHPKWRSTRDGISIDLTLEAAMDLRDQLKPQRGDYVIENLDGLTIHVAPTEIRNQNGEIIDVIG